MTVVWLENKMPKRTVDRMEAHSVLLDAQYLSALPSNQSRDSEFGLDLRGH